MKSRLAFLGAAVLLALTLPQPARAHGGADPQCIHQANADYNACKDVCKDTHKEQKALCRHLDPACVQACRDQRATCSGPFLDILEGCVDGCNAEFENDKAACPPVGDPARDACIDAAQLERFSCRDTCHENPTVRDGLKGCRRAFRDCIKTCHPVEP